ncbi:MAG: hypothetical protein KJO44_10450 [Gemmatimonadetes bacterium]|nr:hypothetical protein [Gemmatimonadota bacterium]NNK49690.1 hypothetical protein [Gemmatimonadota bacterium]
MSDHLNREQISALLDDPEGLPNRLEHVSRCRECAREYEQMSRMRMALSGMPRLDPPAGEWDAVQDRLGLEPVEQPVATPWRRAMGWPLQAAAVLALFAAGLMVGQRLNSGTDAPGPIAAVATTEGADSESSMAIEPAEAYLRTVADLQDLREGFDATASGQAGPAAVAQRITHLDGMIDASRDALREAPADPVLNNFLFQLVDERDDLASQLDQSLRMTAAEY